MIRFPSLFLPLILLLSALQAESKAIELQSAEDAFFAGNNAYLQEDYTSALLAYQEAEAAAQSPELLLNLGNAAYRSGQTGLAIASYEHALSLRPGFAEASANLAYVRNQEEIAAIPEDWISLWAALLPTTIWLITLVASFWIALALWLIGPQFGMAKATARTLLFIGLLAASASALGVYSDYRRSKWAIVIAQDDSAMRVAPTTLSEELLRLKEGEPVRVNQRRGDFAYVSSPANEKGWVALESLSPVSGY